MKTLLKRFLSLAFISSFCLPFCLIAYLFFVQNTQIGYPSVAKTVKVLNTTQSGELVEKEITINGLQQELDFQSVHPGLPFTRKRDLKPCSEVFDVDNQMGEALQCANSQIFSKPPYDHTLSTPNMPTCYVVTASSPDVRETPEFNYINLDLLGKTLAFYDTETREIFVVENYDIKMIYRHELQHYFLTLMDGGEQCDHCHKIWQVCEPPRYTPSEGAIAAGKNKRKSLTIELIENFYRDAILEVKGIVNNGQKGIAQSPGNGSQKVQENGRGQSQVLR